MALWGGGGALLLLVLGLMTIRWMRAGASTPPELWWPLLVGVASLGAGRLWRPGRRELWVVGWIGLGLVLWGLMRMVVEHPIMTMPALYYATFGGAACVAVACGLDLWRDPSRVGSTQ